MHAPVADLWSGFVDVRLVLMHGEVPLVPRIAVDPRQNLHAMYRDEIYSLYVVW